MFSAICVSTGKSASATLSHCVLQAVASNEMDKISARIIFGVEDSFLLGFEFITKSSPLDLVVRVLTICGSADYNALQAANRRPQLK
jgi:hypothetical protein